MAKTAMNFALNQINKHHSNHYASVHIWQVWFNLHDRVLNIASAYKYDVPNSSTIQTNTVCVKNML